MFKKLNGSGSRVGLIALVFRVLFSFPACVSMHFKGYLWHDIAVLKVRFLYRNRDEGIKTRDYVLCLPVSISMETNLTN